MNPIVIVANQNAQEGAAIATALQSLFDVRPVTETEALLGAVDGAVAVVLDTNFSEAQAVDVLMDVLARTQVPVVMVTPDDDPACAVEALRCGAANYLVKTASYAELLPTAVQDAVQRARANEDLKRQVSELRKRNADLEKEIKTVRLKTMLRIPSPAASQEDEPILAMEEVIAERIRNGTLQLPSYPRIATKLRELLQADVGISEVAQLLAQDAAVSAKLLRVANSSQYTNLRPVDSIEGAVSRIGMANACNLAEVIANRSLYSSRNAAYRGLLDSLWEHSIACAHACLAIGRQLGKPSWQKMFSLGLLHDAGRLALVQAVAQADPEGKCVEGEDNQKSFYAFLRKHNPSCGVALMQRWNFDQDFLDAVLYNRDLTGCEKPTRTLMIVNLANLTARAIGYGRPLDFPEELEQSPSKGFLFPGDASLDQIIEEVHHAMEQTRNLLA